MSNIIDKIQISGVTYDIGGSGGGGVPESTFTAYTATTDERISQDEEVTAAGLNALNDKFDEVEQVTARALNELNEKKQDTLSAGTNITIVDNVISAEGGGGTTYSAGTNIDITNDTISCTLSGGTLINIANNKINCTAPIRNGTGIGATIIGDSTNSNVASSTNSIAVGGQNNTASGQYSHAEGYYTTAATHSSHSEGWFTKVNGQHSHSEGNHTVTNKEDSHAEGKYTVTNNASEHASGQYNNSVTGSSTFGDSGNTLFSVGNGTADNARHNAFEIRQNGDIYLSSGGTDIKLQDHLGGGGITSGEVQTMIDDSISGKADTSAVTAVQDSLSGYVTTDTAQDITGVKTFVNGDKGIIFKQIQNSSKVGFSLRSSASSNNELATFELRPNTYTDSSSVSHPLLYLGHYRNTATANAGVPQTMVGFRQYDQSGGAAYHYLMPLPSEAKTPFSLTTTFKNYFAPLGFKNGSTMITTNNTGVADFSDVLGGLKLVKLTQTEYNNLSPKDNNTLYIIVN